jgi:hypothetical protein
MSNPSNTSGFAGTITNTYGIYMASNTLGTNNYGIYQTASENHNYFNSSLSLGTTSSAAKLRVKGDGTNSIMRIENSSNIRHFEVNNNEQVLIGNGSIYSDTKVALRSAGNDYTTASIRIFDSGQSEKIRMRDDGSMNFHVFTTAINSYKPIHIGADKTVTDNSFTNTVGTYSRIQLNNTTNASKSIGVFSSVIKYGSNTGSEILGFNSSAVIASTNTGGVTDLIGGRSYCTINGGGNLSFAFGLESYITLGGSSTGTISRAGGHRVEVRPPSDTISRTITNYHGVQIANPFGINPTYPYTAITNYYGVSIDSNTAIGTNNYGFYQEGTTMMNYFGGNTGVGISPSDVTTLAVGGGLSIGEGSYGFFTADTHNLPLINDTLIRISSDMDVNLTGISGGTEGRIITFVHNGNPDTITLTNEDTNSTAEHRFQNGANGDNIILNQGDSVTYMYSTTIDRWVLVSTTVGGVTSSSTSGVYSISGVTSSVTTNGTTIIGVTNTSSPRTVTISSSDITESGKVFIIKDESGGAGTNNITIATEGSETIDGSSTVTITANYGVGRLYSNGTNLFTW